LKFLALHADDENVKKHVSYDKSAEVAELDESRYELLAISGLCANDDAAASPALAISLVKYLSSHAMHDVGKDESAFDGFFLYRSKAGNVLDAATFPAHYYIWGDMLDRLEDDAAAYVPLPPTNLLN
jgi:hypothetical protein